MLHNLAHPLQRVIQGLVLIVLAILLSVSLYFSFRLVG
jgi:hypothetical protein